jgi:hypothetical protein
LDEKEYAQKDMLTNAGVVTLIMPVYMYFTQALQQIDQQQFIDANRTIMDQ